MATDLSFRIEGGADAPRTARALLEPIGEEVDPNLMATVRLLVSELVSNAVRHAGSKFIEMRAYFTSGLIRIEVADGGQGFSATPLRPDLNRPHGWGLYLVDELADRWGVSGSDGTRVWFEIDRA